MRNPAKATRCLILLLAGLIFNLAVIAQGHAQSITAAQGIGGARMTDQETANVQPPNFRGNNPQLGDAAKALLGAFDKYELVGGMSPAHGNKDIDDFILNLIRNPALPDKVNDIAAECGNSLYQPILDRYIAGEDVPLSQAQEVWRNTTKVPCGLAAFYEQLFPLVRHINEKLPPGKKLRVLACDPPVDWSKIKSQDDMKPFLDRDRSIASIIEREVLEKHRKALLLFGTYHVRHGGGAAGIYERKYPDVAYTIADFGAYPPLVNDELEKRMASWPIPSLVPIKGTWLADLDSAYFGEPGGQLGYPGIDGYLYVGPRDLFLYEPVSAKAILDKDYIAELQRRDDALGAAPTDPRRSQAFLQRESHASVFLYDPDREKKRIERMEKMKKKEVNTQHN